MPFLSTALPPSYETFTSGLGTFEWFDSALMPGVSRYVQPALRIVAATASSDPESLPPPVSARTAITATSARMPLAAQAIKRSSLRRSSGERCSSRRRGAWTFRRGGGGVRGFFAISARGYQRRSFAQGALRVAVTGGGAEEVDDHGASARCRGAAKEGRPVQAVVEQLEALLS